MAARTGHLRTRTSLVPLSRCAGAERDLSCDDGGAAIESEATSTQLVARFWLQWHHRWPETKSYCNITHTSRLILSRVVRHGRSYQSVPQINKLYVKKPYGYTTK